MSAEKLLRMCLKKKPYSSERLAKKVAAKVMAERHVSVRVYYCPICLRYHITHKIDRKESSHG